MSTNNGPLYLGFDLSTQQLKGGVMYSFYQNVDLCSNFIAIVISSELKVQFEAKVDFDADLSKYGIKNGVHVNEAESEVYAPVAMWLEAVDLVLARLKEKQTPFERIRGISGAGQQHGSVFWSHAGEQLLANLKPSGTLVDQLSPQAFAYPWSPNWQDASTQEECDEFDAALDSEEKLAQTTGSKAHHRFTGPQIMRIRSKQPDVYESISRISLVSSFLASLFLASVAPIDISDVCGMNLWDIKAGAWSEPLLKIAGGSSGVDDLKQKLGDVCHDGGKSLGPISNYFVHRYGFHKDCQIAPFTGDNPASILALPLRSMDAMVSLGTSTTFLMSTPKYVPHPTYHFFNHPTTSGLYMFMLCYKNGGLAREKVRDTLPKPKEDNPWANFEELVTSSPPLGQHSSSDPAKIGLYFPLPEIVPNVKAGTWRYTCGVENETGVVEETSKGWKLPDDDARTIVESQILSLRLRSQDLVTSPKEGFPAQPRRIYLVGGGSLSPAIARVVGDVLGGVEGVYKLDVGGNACALGGAYKAVWAMERKTGESFEKLIGERWRESEATVKVDEGYRPDIWKQYGDILPAFEEMEKKVLAGEDRFQKQNS
jgi:xylulokinase